MNFGRTLACWRTRLGLGLLGALLLGLAGMLAWDWYAEFETRTWQAVRCKVLTSQVTDRPRGERIEYAPGVLYSYEYGGKAYLSDQFYRPARFGGGGYSHKDYATVRELLRPFARGTTATCYVNPARPEQAVLGRRLGYTGLVMSIVIPATLTFLYWLVYHQPKPKASSASALARQPLSRRAKSMRGGAGAVALGVFLLAMGFGCFFGLDSSERAAIRQTQDWRPVPCTILESRVEKDGSMHGSEHRLNVLYSYTLTGREYRSNRYQAGSCNGSSSLRRQVERSRQFVPGSTAVCYVNPAAPGEAVLNTRYEPELGWPMFGMALMVVLGAGSLATGLAQWLAPRSALAGWFDKEMGEASFGGGPRSAPDGRGGLTFRSSQGAPVRLGALGLAALVGVGVIAAVVWDKVLDWRVGVIQVGVLDFLIVMIAGAGALWCMQQFRLGLGPQPRVRVYPAQVPAGGTWNVEWQFNGKVGRLEDVQLALEGREEVEIEETTRGALGQVKQKRVCRCVFEREPLVSGAAGKALEWGAARVAVPIGAMHSFESRSCRLLWCLVITGRLSSRTPIRHEFRLHVLPGEVKPGPTHEGERTPRPRFMNWPCQERL